MGLRSWLKGRQDEKRVLNLVLDEKEPVGRKIMEIAQYSRSLKLNELKRDYYLKREEIAAHICDLDSHQAIDDLYRGGENNFPHGIVQFRRGMYMDKIERQFLFEISELYDVVEFLSESIQTERPLVFAHEAYKDGKGKYEPILTHTTAGEILESAKSELNKVIKMKVDFVSYVNGSIADYLEHEKKAKADIVKRELREARNVQEPEQIR